LAVDALVDGILAEVSARGSDPSLLRILRLRVVAAAMLGKRKVLLNVGAEYATVRDCTARVLKDLRPLASQILLAVADILKGGKPDPKGVLALVDSGGEQSSTTLRVCLRKAVHRALVEDRVRKLGQHAWVLQLLSIVVNDMPIGEVLALFENLGKFEDYVFEVTRYQIAAAKKWGRGPGVPIRAVVYERPGCRGADRVLQAQLFIEEHCRQVAPSKAAVTKNVVPIMYVLSRNLAELYSMYLVMNITSQLCRKLIIHTFECYRSGARAKAKKSEMAGMVEWSSSLAVVVQAP
jgi:hypothetical protein